MSPAKYCDDEMKAGELEGHLACVGERRNVRRILVWKPEEGKHFETRAWIGV